MQIKEMILSDEERQPCEVWTRVMGYFAPSASSMRAKRASTLSVNILRNVK